MQGLAEIRRNLSSAYRDFDSLGLAHFPFVHAVANHEIRLTGPDSAEGSCYLLDFVTGAEVPRLFAPEWVRRDLRALSPR